MGLLRAALVGAAWAFPLQDEVQVIWPESRAAVRISLSRRRSPFVIRLQSTEDLQVSQVGLRAAIPEF